MRAAYAGLALLAFYIVVALAADTGSGSERNVRHDVLLWPATAVERISGAVLPQGDALDVGPPGAGTASVTWNVYRYELAHLLGRARSCRITVFFPGTDLTGSSPAASVDVRFDGKLLRRIAFSQSTSGFYALAAGRLFPTGIVPQLIEVVPLDRRYAFAMPLPESACRANEWKFEVRARGARWNVSSVGIALDYLPRAVPLMHDAVLTVGLGAVLAFALLAALFAVLRGFSAIGALPLVAATGVLALAALTYDQWDFSVWLRFAEVAVFGGGDPAHLWTASPLWAFVPSLFASITLASYVASGDGSRTLTELLLKLGVGLAYCSCAYAVARQVPQRMRASFAVAALVVPGGLYEVAGGYREPFAVGLTFLGLTLAVRRKLAFATVALWAAASISETLLPLVLFPAALRLTVAGAWLERVRSSASLAALGIGAFVLEWLLLIPHDVAKFALTYRFGAAQFGGASWAGAASSLGLLPAWLPAGSPAFGAAVLLAAATFPAWRLWLIVRLRQGERPAYDDVLGVFVALEAAFFLAFRGVDPNTWYAFVAVAALYFARVDATNPFPLVMSSAVALTFYGILGLGDFVNQAIFSPVDRGLLGILGVSRHVFSLMLSGFALCALVAAASGRRRMLFSARSPWYAALFACAVATTAIRWYALDLVVCGGATALVAVAFVRGIAAQNYEARARPLSLSRAVVLAALAFVATAACTHSIAAALVAAAATLTAGTFGCGSCDVVLATGAAGVLAVQIGFGPLSLAGWCALAATMLYGLVTSVASGLRGGGEAKTARA